MRNFVITLLVCSVTMSALALFYMAITPLLAKYYSANGRYYAWLVIVIGLIIPFRPQFHNAFIQVEIPSKTTTLINEAGNVFPEDPNIFTLETNTIIPSVPPTISWWQVVAVAWLVGVATFLIYHGVKHYLFTRMVRRWSEVIADERTLSLMQTLREEMGISKHINIYLCSSIGSPMMIGFVNPQIFLPKTQLAHCELRLILKHELVHFKRKDLWYKTLVLVASAIHWFNPVVYLMARAIDRQCELSCDAAVVDNTDMDVRQYYSEAIIGIVRHKSELNTALSTNFYGGKKGMKNRISSIMDTSKKKTGAVIICVVLTLTMATGATFATNEGEQNNIEQIDRKSNMQTVTEDQSMMSRYDYESGKTYYSWDLGKTWTPLTDAEYDVMFPTPDIEWWTYDEYKVWMEQQISDLQALADDGIPDYYDKNDVLKDFTQADVDEFTANCQDILDSIKDGMKVSKTVDGSSDVMMTYNPDDMKTERENISAGIGENIKPYESFGVSYDSETGMMMYDGRPVREIYDHKTATLITISAGTGFIDGVIPNSAIDLTAVYNGEILSGLKVSTQAQFDVRTRERLAYRNTTVVESESSTSADWESSEYDYGKYAEFGMTHDNGKLYYKGELVRYFEDYYSLGESMSAGIDYFYKDGTIDVHSVRDFSQIVHNADGSYDPSGKLIGIESYSKTEFDARDIDKLINPPQAYTTYATNEESYSNTKTSQQNNGAQANNSTAYVIADEDISQNHGETFAEEFLKYKAYGITLDENSVNGGLGNVYYKGQLVKKFVDITPTGGVFTLSSSDGGKNTVYTIYDSDGNLTGVKEVVD